MDVAKDPDNRQTLALLIDRYQRDLLYTCRVLLRDASLAEDAVQETFLRAYKSLERFEGKSSEKTWLTRIAINVCQNMRKSAWHRYVDRRVEIDTLPIAAESAAEENIALMAEIMRLPRREMEAVWLYYFQDLNLEEVAETLGVAISTVSQRLTKARGRLRKALGGLDDE